MSDLHFTQSRMESAVKTEKMLKYIGDIINPEVLLITGDLTDSSDDGGFVQVMETNLENWKMYNESRYNSGIINNRTLIEITGNHDIYGVYKNDSSKNYYNQFAMFPELSKNGNSFIVDLPIFNKINFVTFNPMKFPFPPPPLGTIPKASKRDMDDLKKAIIPGAINIIISHYPITTIWKSSDSNGNSFESIVNQYDIYLSGHTHPEHVEFYHVDDVTNVVSPASKYNPAFGLISIDFGGIGYTECKSITENFISVTYPVPWKQLSKNHVFNLNDFSVKVLGFSNKSLNLVLYIDKQKIGNLTQIKEIKENVSLYSLPVNVKNGKHVLKIEGDSSMEFEFFVGETLPSFKESGLMNLKSLVIGLYAFFFIYAVLHFVPFWLLFKDKLKDFSEFLFYGEGTYSIPKQILYGLLHFWTRLRNVPLLIYIYLIFLSLWIYIIPYIEMKIEGNVIPIFLWGYISNGVNHDMISILIIFCYYLLFIIPLINIIGLYFENDKMCVSQIIEFVLFSISILFATIIWFIIA